jgi:hypothetical protein
MRHVVAVGPALARLTGMAAPAAHSNGAIWRNLSIPTGPMPLHASGWRCTGAAAS